MNFSCLKKYTFFIFLLLLVNTFLFPQENDPAWLLYQKGLKSFEIKDYSQAFILLRDAAVNTDYPEAEYLIGKIFELEGEQVLSLKQYERALEKIHYSTTDNFDIIIRLSMADIYYRRREFSKYENILERIISESEENRNSDYMRYITVMSERIKNLGLDRMLYYYRHEGDYFIRPHGELGIFYFSTSRDQQSLLNLTAAVSIISSNLVRTFTEYDPDYTYINFSALFTEAENNQKTLNYLINTDYYKYLFYLALVLDNFNLADYSSYIFDILAVSRVDNEYKNMALQIVQNRFSKNYLDRIKKRLLLSAE